MVTRVKGSVFDFDDNKSSYNIYDVCNAKGDGVTDDSAEINAAITAVAAIAAADDRTVYLDFDSGVFACKEITLRKLVVLRFNGSRMLFNGVAGEYLINTSVDEVVYDSGVINLQAELGVGSGLDLHSVASSIFDINVITSNSTTNTILRCVADSTSGASRTGTRNFAANLFTRLHHTGTCGTAVYLEGRDSGAPSYSQRAVVTLNTFTNFIFDYVSVIGYELSKWVDSNDFNGIHRVDTRADNALGARFGINHQSGVRGVYNNTFQSLAVDQFGDHVGRKGLVFWTSRNNRVYNFHMDVGNVSDPIYIDDAVTWDSDETTSFFVNHQGRNTSYSSGKSMVIERGIQHIGDFKYTTIGTGTGTTSGTTELTLKFITKKFDHGLGYTVSGATPGFPATDIDNYDPTTGQYTVPLTGIYQFIGNINGTQSNATDSFYLDIVVKGSGGGVAFRDKQILSADAQGLVSKSISALYDLVEGQTVELTVQRRAGSGTISLTEVDGSQCTFAGFRLRGS